MALAHPDRDRLVELVACCRKRVARAAEKLRAAQAECAAAGDALDGQLARVAQWDRENPDPQGSLLEGLDNV